MSVSKVTSNKVEVNNSERGFKNIGKGYYIRCELIEIINHILMNYKMSNRDIIRYAKIEGILLEDANHSWNQDYHLVLLDDGVVEVIRTYCDGLSISLKGNVIDLLIRKFSPILSKIPDEVFSSSYGQEMYKAIVVALVKVYENMCHEVGRIPTQECIAKIVRLENMIKDDICKRIELENFTIEDFDRILNNK